MKKVKDTTYISNLNREMRDAYSDMIIAVEKLCKAKDAGIDEQVIKARYQVKCAQQLANELQSKLSEYMELL